MTAMPEDENKVSTGPQPIPVEHVGAPFTDSVPSSPARSRPTSFTADAGLHRRGHSMSQSQRPSARHHSHAVSISALTSTVSDLVEVDESSPKESDFLTALASQERRVLELRDELQRAEDELSRLKKSWAHHEDTRRRTDGRRLHQLRPVSVSHTRYTSRADDLDGSSAWMYEEMERRKALMGHTRTSSRRVFSGSRHARKLSLVPPARGENTSAYGDESLKHGMGPLPRSSRSATMQGLESTIRGSQKPSHAIKEAASAQHEVLQAGMQTLQNGTKLASELKDGLWNFFEELKQVAVGEDTKGHQTSRKDSPKVPQRESDVEAAKTWTSLIRPQHDRTSHVDGSASISSTVWRDHGIGIADRSYRDPKSEVAPRQTPHKAVQPTSEYEEESWETWDTPDAKQSSPTASSDSSTRRTSNSFGSSPATSNDGASRRSTTASKRDSIPWPALAKYTPAQLRRTASHLMDEWERSLSPSQPDTLESLSTAAAETEARTDNEATKHELLLQSR